MELLERKNKIYEIKTANYSKKKLKDINKSKKINSTWFEIINKEMNITFNKSEVFNEVCNECRNSSKIKRTQHLGSNFGT